MRLSLQRFGEFWEAAIVDGDQVTGDVYRGTYDDIRTWALAQGLTVQDLPAMMQQPIVVRQERELPAHMLQCRYPATYHGSLTEHHGDWMVTLDHENMDFDDFAGETRYVVYAKGATLTNVRASSLTFP